MQTERKGKNGLFGEPTTAKAAGLGFSLATILPVVLSFVLLTAVTFSGTDYENADWYLYIGYLLPQLSFAFVAFWFLRYTGTSLRAEAKAQKCHPKYFLWAFLLQIGLLSLSELNALFLKFLGNFGYEDAGISLPSMEGFGFVGVLLVVAVFPAIFEEVLFRGIVLKGLRGFGQTGAVLLCGALFALYHQNPAQTVYQFCCGAAFALVALRSGSVLPTIISHFLNNTVILVLTKLEISSFSTPVWIAVLCVSVVCLALSVVYFVFIDRKPKTPAEKGDSKGFFPFASVGLAVCVFTWLAVMLSGM